MKVIQVVGEERFNDKLKRLARTLAIHQGLKPVQVPQHSDVVGAASSDHAHSEDPTQPEGLEVQSKALSLDSNVPNVEPIGREICK